MRSPYENNDEMDREYNLDMLTLPQLAFAGSIAILYILLIFVYPIENKCTENKCTENNAEIVKEATK